MPPLAPLATSSSTSNRPKARTINFHNAPSGRSEHAVDLGRACRRRMAHRSGVADRGHRFRKQGELGAAKHVTDIYCSLPWRSDQAWSSRRGRLRVLSTVAFAPPSIVCSTRRLPVPGAHAARELSPGHWRRRLAEAAIASDATYSVAGNRIASRGPAARRARGARIAYAARRRRSAQREGRSLAEGCPVAASSSWNRALREGGRSRRSALRPFRARCYLNRTPKRIVNDCFLISARLLNVLLMRRKPFS